MAALIAALGSAMVFLYVRGADDRAQAEQAPVEVLKAVSVINPGETLQEAQAAGKLQIGEVPTSQVLSGAVNSISGINDQVALSAVYPNEQIITSKFGSPGSEDVLTLPDKKLAVSVSLTDPGRVAGFVEPGAEVTIFFTTETISRVLLEKVQVVAVGQTTVTTTTTTNEQGAQTTEELPRTLMTLAVDQDEAERIKLGEKLGELSFGLLNDKSSVKPTQGTRPNTLFR